MVDREDVGSWLSGPPVGGAGGAGGPATGARGTRLGLPPSGPGSLAPIGRRLLALVVDWAACVAIAAVFFGGDPIAQLLVFAAENLLLVGTVGFTLGHRLLGLRVRRVLAPRTLAPVGAGEPDVAPDPGPDVPPGPLLGLVRTVLLCLVIPAVVWDADGRGLHDRFAATAIVRR